MSTNMDYGWLADVANEVGITDDDLTALSTPGFIARAMMTAMDRNAVAALQAKQNQFVSTANSLVKMYQHATDNSIEPDKATSSRLPVNIFVYLDDLSSATVVDTSTNKRKLTIGKSTVFKVESYKFYLDYDINIYQYKVNGVLRYYAQYDMSESNPVSDIKNSVISVRKYLYGGRECLALSVKLRDTLTYTSEVGYTDASSGSIFTVSYVNNIEYIHVQYKDSSTDDYRVLNTAMFFNKNISGETLFYLIKKDTVVFMNKYTGGNFEPTPGGRFKFTIHATPLTSFSTYAGSNLTVTMNDEANFEVDFSPTSGTVTGKAAPTLEELRSLITTQRRTLNALISAPDVDAFLEENGNSDTMYNTYKYVDNFYDRIYNIVLRIGSISKIVPTNSVDLLLNDMYCNTYGNGRYIVPRVDQKFIAVRDEIDKEYVRVIPEEMFKTESKYKDMDGSIAYALPFQLCYDRQYNVVSTFSKLMNATRELLFTYVDDSSEVFVVENLSYAFNVDANNDKEYYNFEFEMTTDSEDLINAIIADPEYVTVYVSLINANGSHLCYIKGTISEYNSSTQTYKVVAPLLMTTPVYSSYIKVKTYDVMNNDDTSVVETEINLNDAYPRISIYVKDTTTHTTPSKYMSFNDKKLVNVFDIFRDVDDPDDGMLFAETSSYMSTQVSKKYTNSKPTGKYDAISGVVLDKIPVVKYAYYYAEQENVQALIQNEMSILDTIGDKVDGLFKVRLNFVNSYGYSRLVQIGLDGRSINTTHLVPKIKVGLSEDSTLTKLTLASFINAYLSEVNFKNGDVFYFTNLVTSIKSNYSDVKFVELLDMNGFTSDNQKIYMTTTTNAKYISEVVNISRDDDDSFDISIEFVYE